MACNGLWLVADMHAYVSYGREFWVAGSCMHIELMRLMRLGVINAKSAG
jgi:hypothetical protein